VIVKENTLFIPDDLIYKYSGKLVLYSSKLKTVSVINENEYNKLNDFFNSLNENLSTLTDCSFKVNMDMDMGNYGKQNYNMLSVGTYDQTDEIIEAGATTTVTGITKQVTNTQSYSIKGVNYTKDGSTGEWKKDAEEDTSISMFSGFISGIDNNDSGDDADYDAVINSSCILTTSNDGSITNIQSNLFSDTLADEIGTEVFSGGTPSKIDMTISVDNKAKIFKDIIIKMSGSMVTSGIKVNLIANITVSFSDYNTGNKISIPDDLSNYIQTLK